MVPLLPARSEPARSTKLILLQNAKVSVTATERGGLGNSLRPERVRHGNGRYLVFSVVIFSTGSVCGDTDEARHAPVREARHSRRPFAPASAGVRESVWW